jgi:hypothetical protein
VRRRGGEKLFFGVAQLANALEILLEDKAWVFGKKEKFGKGWKGVRIGKRALVFDCRV